MAKELPYFKFNASEWISGEITLEDLNTQGAFINICAYYWFKSGCLTLTEIKRRLKLKQATIDSLIKRNHIKVDEDRIEISFLREQFDERGYISQRNSLNGSKGGAPKGNKNAEKNNREQPKTTNIEEENNKNRIEEEREIKTLAWFRDQIDSMYFETLQMTHKGKDIEQAIKESYNHVASDSLRLHNLDGAGAKRLVNTWLTNTTRTNGHQKERKKLL